MPQLGETVTEGTITKWFKAVGDTVARDEPLFEVSTDKVDSEVPSPADGILTAILVEEGDTVDVGVALAVIDGDMSAAPAAPASVAESSPQVPAPVPATPLAALSDEPVTAAEVVPAPAVTAAPAVAPAAAKVTASVPASASAPASASQSPAARTDLVDQSLVLSPVVRRLLTDHALDAASIQGTGLGGRITRSDVEAVTGAAGCSRRFCAARCPRAPCAGSGWA